MSKYFHRCEIPWGPLNLEDMIEEDEIRLDFGQCKLIRGLSLTGNSNMADIKIEVKGREEKTDRVWVDQTQFDSSTEQETRQLTKQPRDEIGG